MSKITHRLMSAIVLLALAFGSYISAGASSAPAAAAPANPYYVSVSGNDANTGTLASPFKTIQKCINVAVAGSTCLVRAGTYNENLVINKSGTASSPITLARYQSEAVTINGGTSHGIRDAGGSSYWIIDGFTITTTGASSVPVLVTSANWGGSTPTHWIVRNNTLLGGGVLIRGSYHLVENNTINGQHLAKSSIEWQSGIRDTWGGGATGNASPTHHNIFRRNTIFGFYRSAIWSMGYTHDNIAEYNTIYDIYGTGNAGQCINFDGADTVEWRNTVRGNDISGCGSESIQLENGFDSLIENNNIHNTNRGITLINYAGGTVTCKVGGENNQYGDTNGDGSCRDGNTNNIIRQNILVNASGGAFVNYGMDGVHYLNNSAFGGNAGMAFSRPEFLKFSDAIGNIITSTLPTGLRTRANNIAPSGVYKNPPSDLSPIGSAVDKIAAVDTYQNSVTGGWSLDFAGNPRLAGASYDIGAYEFAGVITATSTPVPPTNTAAPTASPLPATPTRTLLPATPTATSVLPTATATTIPPTVIVTATPVPTGLPVTPTSVLPTAQPASETFYDDKVSAIVYSAGWEDKSMADAYNGSMKLTTQNDSSMTFVFTGQYFGVVYRGGPNYGKMKVYVDGVQVDTLDQKLATYTSQKRWDYAGQLTPGIHTLQLVFVNSGYAPGSIDAVIVR
jgi:hypothetical protein